MTQISDALYLGDAPGPGGDTGGRGIGPMGRFWTLGPITPLAAGTSTIAASQAMSTSLTLSGSLVTNGPAIPDVPRSIQINATTADNISGTNVTVSGFDQYGVRITNTIAGPNGTNTVNTNKAFKSVTSIAFAGAGTTTVVAGIGDRFGFPYRVVNGAYVASARMVTSGSGSNVFAVDAGTILPADTTATATASTTDVRGWYKPSVASDGTRTLLVQVYADGTAAGASGVATQIGAYGVTQA